MHEQTQLPIGKGYHLLVGLGNDIVPEPIRVARLLLERSTSSLNNTHIGRELLDLDWHDNDAEFLTDIWNHNGDPAIQQNNRWSCRCARLTMDEIRQLHMASIRDALGKLTPLDVNNDKKYDCDNNLSNLVPSGARQVRESGCKMTRKKLLQHVELARKLNRLECFNKLGQLQTNCLYELERLVRITNSWLTSLFDQLALEDSQKLISIVSRSHDDAIQDYECCVAPWGRTLEGGLPIGARAPTIQYYYDKNDNFGDKVSLSRLSPDSSQDSGISLIVNLTTAREDDSRDGQRGRRSKHVVARELSRSLRFRSSEQFSKIIAFSCQLFQELLSNSRLLQLDVTNEIGPLSPNQLRLDARVECRKMRASLRFEWLAKCMWLALDKDDQLPTGRYNLPPNCATQEEIKYLNAITRLMGYLLREHFLERALDLWIAAIEQKLSQTRFVHRCKLLILVELTENQELRVSQPEILLKETLEFVCDELVSACSHLPRIESQFWCDEDSYEEITVLAFGDNLLELKRTKLACAIDRATKYWISPEYLQVIEVINNFRSGSHSDPINGLESHVYPNSPAIFLKGFEICANIPQQDRLGSSSSSFEAQLGLTCRRVKLLDQLEQRLRCHLSTGLNIGELVQLDLRTLNERLIKIVVKERLLLVKLQADELSRLMDKLRLQYDELEINIDLETAIEDYLNERWQVKQSQQPDLEQRILLDDDDNDDNLAQTMLDCLDLPSDAVEPQQDQDTQAIAEPVLGVNGTIHEEDEFLQALVSDNNPNVAHLFAISDPTGSAAPGREQQFGRRQGQSVAPLIECRILLGRYKYLNKFARDELTQFTSDLQFLLTRGLEFLSEILPRTQSFDHNRIISTGQQLESEQLEALAEISLRTREFSLLMKEALARLEQTSGRLVESAKLRANILSRTLLEFNWLMIKLGERQLEPLNNDASDTNIKQLDFIQETSSWSQRLEIRWNFLDSQNGLLRRELTLLLVECKHELEEFAARLPGSIKLPTIDNVNQLEIDYEHEFQVRAGILKQWEIYTKQVNLFWRLIEEFETQQVKWLNSDAKKLEYEQVVGAFEENFVSQFDGLQSEVGQAYEKMDKENAEIRYDVLQNNLDQLNQRLARFRRVCLPIFKFLTNKHLTREHWIRLSELLVDDATRSGIAPDTDQVYTTVAQLLDQLDAKGNNLQLSQLDIMSHEATREHELGQLIATEVARNEQACRSLKSQLESLEASAQLDTWSDRELAVAASRFIRIKLESPRGRATIPATDLDELARKLVACHSAVRRYEHLRGHLNLDLPAATPPAARNLSREKPRSEQTVVLRPRHHKMTAALLVELLRLFTSSWLEREAKILAKFNKVSGRLTRSQQHLGEIESLLEEAKSLQTTDLEVATREGERQLAQLQRDSLKMDLEREILATRESASLERQREAMRARDICIRQVSERAVPALRAATQALDCLGDGRSALRALRSYRPSPPLAVRLVIEAVCLLRNGCNFQDDSENLANLTSPSSHQDAHRRVDGQRMRASTVACQFPADPVRRFDTARGQIVEDYWPIARRTLNGIHSSQFIADLRQVSKRTIPAGVMLRIRRKYLSRPEFNVGSIGQVSRQAALLASWLIAVDVFDRVLNIVRPNHEECLQAEENLSKLMGSVTESRQQIDTLGRELEQLEESIGIQVKRRATLVDLIDDCRARSNQLEVTRGELLENISSLRIELNRLQRNLDRVAHRCLWDSVRLVYLDYLPQAERAPIEHILRRELNMQLTSHLF